MGLQTIPDPNVPLATERWNAGAFGYGQTDMTSNGREGCSATATVNVPVGTVPAAKTFFLTDVQLSTVATVEIDCIIAYILGGITVPLFRAAITSTSPCTAVGIESQPDAPAGAALVLILPLITPGPAVVDFTIGGFSQ